MHDPQPNELDDALYRVAEYGGGRPITVTVPEDALVLFGSSGKAHPFDGITITAWSR